MTEWREVCRWDVEDGHLSERGRQAGEREDMASEFVEYVIAFHNALVAFEELAGEHSVMLQGAINMANAFCESLPPCPGDIEDYALVRTHWRPKPRRSKLAAIDPDQGTVQAAPGEGQTGASGEATGHSPEGTDPQIRDAYCRGRSGIPLGNWCNESQSGDATGADKEQPCPGCGSYRGTHGLGCRILALTQSGEERSE